MEKYKKKQLVSVILQKEVNLVRKSWEYKNWEDTLQT